jgi:hypothetical protein
MTTTEKREVSPLTIDELIEILEQQKKQLGGDYFPRIVIDDMWHLIEEVATAREDCGSLLPVLALYPVPERLNEITIIPPLADDDKTFTADMIDWDEDDDEVEQS